MLHPLQVAAAGNSTEAKLPDNSCHCMSMVPKEGFCLDDPDLHGVPEQQASHFRELSLLFVLGRGGRDGTE